MSDKLKQLIDSLLPPQPTRDKNGQRVPWATTGPDPNPRAKAAFEGVTDTVLGALGVKDPLSVEATPATGLGALLGMLGPAAMVGGVKRLYRVEPKDFKDSGAWLQKHLSPQQWEAMVNERGRLFGDNLNLAEQFGHGSPDFTTYAVDVPDMVAAAAKRKHSNADYDEYLLPPEYVAKKKPYTVDKPAPKK